MAAAAAAAESFEEFDCVPQPLRLEAIKASFVPGKQAGRAVWPAEVLEAWGCRMHADALLFECRLGSHAPNSLRLFIYADLS